MSLTKSFLDDIHKLRTAICQDVLDVIHSFVDTTQHSTPAQSTDYKHCLDCDHVNPSRTMRCGHCRSTSFQTMSCTCSTRTDELIKWLKLNELWPLHRQLHRSPCEIRQILSGPLPLHKCAGGPQCSMEAKEEMTKSVVSVLADASGLELDSYRVLS